jgi:Protein of unknown function (DUF4232)
MVVVALLVAGCGGSSGSSSDSSTTAASLPCAQNNTPAHPVVVLPICPRPPRSAIPIARARLRKTLAEVKDPDLPAVVIRRLELLVDVMYQAGRCGEHEIEECNYERWNHQVAKIWKQAIVAGYFEEIVGLRRVLIEEGFHNQAARNGPRSIGARTWGRRLLRLEEKGAGQCRGIPTCDYEKVEAAAAQLRREMGLPARSELLNDQRAAPCQFNNLAVHPGSKPTRAGGTVYTKLLVVVTSPYPCTLAGVPAVAALGRGGRVLETARQVHGLRPGHRKDGRVVTLRRGHPAFFFVAHDEGTSSSRCASARTRALRVRLPGSRRRTVVAYRVGYCPPPEGDLGLQVGRIE